jgi:dienelactone hydrolase
VRRDIEFTAEDGTVLRGFLHSSGMGSSPGNVMTHGFSGVKEQIDHYASLFAEHGFSVVLYEVTADSAGPTGHPGKRLTRCDRSLTGETR